MEVFKRADGQSPTYGSLLRRRRTHCGMSQHTLGRLVGWNTPKVIAVERDEEAIPWDSATRLAEIFAVPPDIFAHPPEGAAPREASANAGYSAQIKRLDADFRALEHAYGVLNEALKEVRKLVFRRL